MDTEFGKITKWVIFIILVFFVGFSIANAVYYQRSKDTTEPNPPISKDAATIMLAINVVIAILSTVFAIVIVISLINGYKRETMFENINDPDLNRRIPDTGMSSRFSRSSYDSALNTGYSLPPPPQRVPLQSSVYSPPVTQVRSSASQNSQMPTMAPIATQQYPPARPANYQPSVQPPSQRLPGVPRNPFSTTSSATTSPSSALPSFSQVR